MPPNKRPRLYVAFPLPDLPVDAGSSIVAFVFCEPLKMEDQMWPGRGSISYKDREQRKDQGQGICKRNRGN